MSDPTPYSRRSPLEHERDEGGMSDELVKRLREGVGMQVGAWPVMIHEAADRIEALQAEALDWRAQVGELSDKCKALKAENAQLRDALYQACDRIVNGPRAALAQEAVKAPAPRLRIVTEPRTTFSPNMAWRAYCPMRPSLGTHYGATEEAARNKCAAALAQEGKNNG